jgi:hypothetical protein
MYESSPTPVKTQPSDGTPALSAESGGVRPKHGRGVLPAFTIAAGGILLGCSLFALAPEIVRLVPNGLTVDGPSTIWIEHDNRQEPVRAEYLLRNRGWGPLTIQRVSTSCGCLSNKSQIEGTVLQRGETVRLEVSMNLGDKKTTFDETMEVRSSKNPVILHLMGHAPAPREILFRPHRIVSIIPAETAEFVRIITVLVPSELSQGKPFVRISGGVAGDCEIVCEPSDDYSKLVLRMVLRPLWETAPDDARSVKGLVEVFLDTDRKLEIPVQVLRRTAVLATREAANTEWSSSGSVSPRSTACFASVPWAALLPVAFHGVDDRSDEIVKRFLDHMENNVPVTGKFLVSTDVHQEHPGLTKLAEEFKKKGATMRMPAPHTELRGYWAYDGLRELFRPEDEQPESFGTFSSGEMFVEKAGRGVTLTDSDNKPSVYRPSEFYFRFHHTPWSTVLDGQEISVRVDRRSGHATLRFPANEQLGTEATVEVDSQTGQLLAWQCKKETSVLYFLRISSTERSDHGRVIPKKAEIQINAENGRPWVTHRLETLEVSFPDSLPDSAFEWKVNPGTIVSDSHTKQSTTLKSSSSVSSLVSDQFGATAHRPEPKRTHAVLRTRMEPDSRQGRTATLLWTLALTGGILALFFGFSLLRHRRSTQSL